MARCGGARAGAVMGLVFALMGMAPTGHAQVAPGRTIVEGVVTAAEGSRPVAGVTVEIVELGARAVTDGTGRFRLRSVPAGTWTVRVEVSGRSVLEQAIRVPASGVLRETFVLSASPVPLRALVVLLDRTRLSEGSAAELVPGSVHVLGARTLEQRPVLFGDVHAYLREVPGVNVQEEEGYGLRPNIGLRGTGVERSSKITLMEDGVLIAPAPYAAPAAYYFPVAGRMEAIEVRKGSSQIRYGPSTIGGALNLVSSGIPSDLSLLVDAAGGGEDSRRLRVRAGDSGDRIGWLLDTYRASTDGFKRLDGGGATGFDVQDYVGKLRWTSRPGASVHQELELKLGYYDERSDETYLGLTAADFEATPLRRYAASQEDVMRADHRQLQVRHFARPTPSIDVVTTAYVNEFARNWYKLQSVLGASLASVLDEPAGHAESLGVLRGGESGADALRVRANNREYSARGVQTAVGLRVMAGVEHELEVGARYHWDEEDRFQHEDGYAMRAGRMALTTAGGPGTQANRVSDATSVSAYVQDRIPLGRLTLAPGLRYETITFERRDYAPGDATRAEHAALRRNDVTVWIPGLGSTYALRPGLRLFAGVHRGFGPPGPGADSDTKAESSINYELGARLDRSATSLHLALFHNDYDNVLGVETLASGTQGTGDLFNGGEVSVWGIELAASHDPLALDPDGWRLPAQLSYTYTSARFETSFESSFEPWGDVESGDALPYLPQHQFFARADVERGAWSAGLSLTATSRMRTVAGQGPIAENEEIDGFAVLGAGVRFAVTPATTLHVGIENLTDARYAVARRPAGLRPGLPRTLQLGVRVER